MKIPESIEEAIHILDEMFKCSEKDEQKYIKNMESADDMIVYHSWLGRTLRNNWGFWLPETSPLKEEIISFGSGTHPDDMSMFILKVFYHHVKFPTKLIKQILDEIIIKTLLE